MVSIVDLISSVKDDYAEWETSTTTWFRGEPQARWTALQPTLYRRTAWRDPVDENLLLQRFRMKAPSLGITDTPPRNHTDEWLFLAQHVGLPTRLLDWTESLFVALHFALLEERPVLWMINPIALNELTLGSPIPDDEFSLTWFSCGWTPVRLADLLILKRTAEADKQNPSTNPFDALDERFVSLGLANANVKAAWEKDSVGTNLPVAIHPTNIHPRMSAQKSCFTIHGKDKRSLALQVGSSVLRKYSIDAKARDEMSKDLRMMGVTHSSVFPDLDGLARDLKLLLP